jgi:hypothetical protein
MPEEVEGVGSFAIHPAPWLREQDYPTGGQVLDYQSAVYLENLARINLPQ